MNSVTLLMTWAAMVPAVPPTGSLTVSARLLGDQLVAGGRYRIIVDAESGDGFSVSQAGMPAPILQIQAPSSVLLTGDSAILLAELKKSGFLNGPHELLLAKNPLAFDFILKSAPATGDSIFLNFVAYLRGSSPEETFLVRRRLALPLFPKATAEDVEPTSSQWGIGNTLQIGDKAANFALPRADGSKLELSELIGKKNVVITTYRAHW